MHGDRDKKTVIAERSFNIYKLGLFVVGRTSVANRGVALGSNTLLPWAEPPTNVDGLVDVRTAAGACRSGLVLVCASGLVLVCASGLVLVCASGFVASSFCFLVVVSVFFFGFGYLQDYRAEPRFARQRHL